MSFLTKLKTAYIKLVTDKRRLALILAFAMLLIGALMLIYPMFAKMFNEYSMAKAMTEYYSFVASANEGVTIP